MHFHKIHIAMVKFGLKSIKTPLHAALITGAATVLRLKKRVSRQLVASNKIYRITEDQQTELDK